MRIGLHLALDWLRQIVAGLYAPPTWNVVTPNSGPEAGGTTVLVQGSDFQNNTQVSFGFTWVWGTFIDSQNMTAVTPPGVGVVGTQLTSTNDAQACNGPAFTYIAAPVVSAVTPNTGLAIGGTVITDLAGTGFQVGATVTFGGVAATVVVRVSAIKITCITPAHAAGAVDIVVTNPDTQNSGASGAGLYTYL